MYKRQILVSTTRSSYSDLTRAINPYYYQADYDKETNSYTLTNIVEGEEYLSYNQGSRNINTTNYVEAAISYNRTFGVHATSGMLVYTRREEKRSSEDTLQKSLPRRNQGLAGRFTYAYDSRYFAEFNFGYNGSERFAAHERYGFFPSFGLGYIISNESFWEPLLNTMDKLKFKMTYGLVGNDAIGSSDDRFYYLSEVNPNDGGRGQYFGTNYGNQMNGVSISRYPNTNITWEKSKKGNFGIELGMFNSALEVQADFFYERRTQIYQNRAYIPSTMGLSAGVSANIGEASSRGVDLSVNYSYIANKDFWIKGMGNFTLAKGRYEVYEEPDYASYGQGHRSRIGQPINFNYGYIAERLFIDENDVANSPSQTSFNGGAMPGDIKYKDINGDGIIDGNDKVAIGATTKPNLIYGFGMSAKWKGLDVNVHFQGSGKSTFFIDGTTVQMFSGGDGWGNVLKEMANGNRWILGVNEDPNAEFPRLTYGQNPNNYQKSDYWLRDGSYLRLKTLDIGYSLPTALVNKIHLNRVRVFFVGTNLLTFSDFKLWDPELGVSDGKKYPLSRTFSLGVSVNL